VASGTRDVSARLLPRLLELGAIAYPAALASEAVCLNASRILAGRNRSDERQNHDDDLGHRCQPSVHEELDQRGDLQSRNIIERLAIVKKAARESPVAMKYLTIISGARVMFNGDARVAR
jgi:hypothetical protein